MNDSLTTLESGVTAAATSTNRRKYVGGYHGVSARIATGGTEPDPYLINVAQP